MEVSAQASGVSAYLDVSKRASTYSIVLDVSSLYVCCSLCEIADHTTPQSISQELYLGLPGCAWRLIVILVSLAITGYFYGSRIIGSFLSRLPELQELKPAEGLHTS